MELLTDVSEVISDIELHPAWPKEEKSTGPPLPPNWVRVPHEGDHYYWNTQTNEASLT